MRYFPFNSTLIHICGPSITAVGWLHSPVLTRETSNDGMEGAQWGPRVHSGHREPAGPSRVAANETPQKPTGSAEGHNHRRRLLDWPRLRPPLPLPDHGPIPDDDERPRPTDDPDDETGAPACAREMFPSPAWPHTWFTLSVHSKFKTFKDTETLWFAFSLIHSSWLLYFRRIFFGFLSSLWCSLRSSVVNISRQQPYGPYDQVIYPFISRKRNLALLAFFLPLAFKGSFHSKVTSPSSFHTQWHSLPIHTIYLLQSFLHFIVVNMTCTLLKRNAQVCNFIKSYASKSLCIRC